VYVQNEISYKTYISYFSYFKNCWNGVDLKLIYGTTLVFTIGLETIEIIPMKSNLLGNGNYIATSSQ